MSGNDWDSELKKIDRMLEGASDEALLPAKSAKTPQARAEMVEKQRTTSTLGVMARLLLATALGVGMLFWPYDAKCGAGLAGYLAATGVVTAAGVSSSRPRKQRLVWFDQGSGAGCRSNAPLLFGDDRNLQRNGQIGG